MTAHFGGVTKSLLGRLLSDQARRAEQERRLPYAEKLRIADQLMRQARAFSKRRRPVGSSRRRAS